MRFLIRMGRILVCALVFPLAIILIGTALSGGPVLPDAFTPDAAASHDEAAASVLTTLSGSLLTVGLTLIAFSLALLRFPDHKGLDIVCWVLAITGAGAAIVSIFLGYRFQIDVATQLAAYRLNIPTVIDRLKSQAGLALLSTSVLFALGLDRFQPITISKNPEGGVLWFGKK